MPRGRPRGQSAILLNSQVGSARDRSGKDFQRRLDECHRCYSLLGQAKLARLESNAIETKSGLRYTRGTPCDYIGRYGRWPVAFDAKVITGQTKLVLPSVERDMRRFATQIEWLTEFSEHGLGIGFFLLYDRELTCCWICHAKQAQALLHGGTVPIRSLTRQAIEHHLPVVEESSVYEMSQGQPRWEYLGVALKSFPSASQHPEGRGIWGTTKR